MTTASTITTPAETGGSCHCGDPTCTGLGNPPVPSAIAINLRAALQVLEGAERLGLPSPFDVGVTSTETKLGFRTYAHLADWSTWMGVPIESNDRASTKATHHTVEGEAFDHPVKLFTVEFISDDTSILGASA